MPYTAAVLDVSQSQNAAVKIKTQESVLFKLLPGRPLLAANVSVCLLEIVDSCWIAKGR